MRKILFAFIFITFAYSLYAEYKAVNLVKGTVTTSSGEALDYVSVYIKGSSHACFTDEQGNFSLRIPRGNHEIVFSLLGYETQTIAVSSAARGETTKLNVVLQESAQELSEVVVQGKSAVQKINESAFNAVAIDVKGLHNTTLDLAGTLAKLPGVKLRESGGVGSDMQFSLDGFSGKHVKFFIDGVPLDSRSSSFSINNIPINFAERIEVYRGVVPVEFGADVLGGVVNIVTGNKRRTFVDASYSYGSFNTHKSYINVGHTTKKGFTVELNAFQNYSDNNYYIYNYVKEFTPDGHVMDQSKIEKVKRFHDTYHNEAVVAKAGFVNTRFADRLLFGINVSQSDKEIQTGVKQDIVFGQKRRKSSSIMPSFEYKKKNLFTTGLDAALSATYNKNFTQNIDTATYIYNWRGESQYNEGKLGEQSYQNSKNDNHNWNATANVNYRIGEMHTIVLNHTLTAFDRKNRGDSENQSQSSEINKTSRKNISGLSYRFNYRSSWNISAFGKYYNQYSKGPRNESTESGRFSYVEYAETVDAFGYGAAGTYFFLKDFQAKFSYEKALRLPSTDELFGDEDLELGALGIKPEKSDNYNINLSYGHNFRKHGIYIEGGLLYRDTKDYIRRLLSTSSGGVINGSYENHGNVKTKGFSSELRYNYSNWFSIGGNITYQDIRSYEKDVNSGTLQKTTTYKVRVPNIPYFFFNADASVYIHDLWGKGNLLTLTYDNFYAKEFPLEWENEGLTSTKDKVPNQFSHNAGIIYSLKNGRYNFSFECRNLTDARLYDNFSLQKAGRAFYGKFRYFFWK